MELLKTQFNSNPEEEIAGPKFKGNTTDIWDASTKGSLPAVKFYFDENPTNINKHNEAFSNWTPLHYASKNGHLNIVKFLIATGAEIDTLSTNNVTPLLHACNQGHYSVINFLLNNGANINHQNIHKSTSLHYAVDGKHLKIVKLLIQRGANKLLKDDLIGTPLESAKIKNYTAIVKYLSSN